MHLKPTTLAKAIPSLALLSLLAFHSRAQVNAAKSKILTRKPRVLRVFEGRNVRGGGADRWTEVATSITHGAG